MTTTMGWKKFWKWLRLSFHRRDAWEKLVRFHTGLRCGIVDLAWRLAALTPRIALKIGFFKEGLR